MWAELLVAVLVLLVTAYYWSRNLQWYGGTHPSRGSETDSSLPESSKVELVGGKDEPSASEGRGAVEEKWQGLEAGEEVGVCSAVSPGQGVSPAERGYLEHTEPYQTTVCGKTTQYKARQKVKMANRVHGSSSKETMVDHQNTNAGEAMGGRLDAGAGKAMVESVALQFERTEVFVAEAAPKEVNQHSSTAGAACTGNGEVLIDTDIQAPQMACKKVHREMQSSQKEVREEPTTDNEVFSAAACAEAFRRHYDDLLTAIQDPEVVATRLFSQHVVCHAVLEEVCTPTLTPIQRKTRLLSAVKNQIAVNPKAFGLLLQVLKMEPYLMDLAQRLEQTYLKCKCEPSITNLQEPVVVSHLGQSQPPNAIATYASYLKSVYLRQKFPSYGKLPHSPSRKYTNLASVKKEQVSKEQADAFTKATIHGGIDDVARKKVPISMEEIAVMVKGVWPKCILVEGVPGIGKSTFAWKMCRKWGKGKILQDYRLVVLLSLREKKVREAKCVSDLFRIYNQTVRDQVVNEVEDSEGKGVLLLFEGYDELPETIRTQDSLFLDIIHGKDLPYATVLITSRPSASGFLYEECKDYLSQHIEILGFTSENIQYYLESTCGSDPSLLSGIQKYLQCYPHIRTMMYVPLNAAIVVEVYRTSKKNQSLVPQTMTQLYECLVRSLLRRFLNDHPVYGKRKWRIRKFDDLPPDVYTQLCELGKIAYDGISKDRQVIFDDLTEDFVTLGLMQCVPELYVDEGAAVSHSFLHLTMQEFMAAFHLSRHPVEGQVDIEAPYQTMVTRFLAGLTGLEGKTFGKADTDQLKLDLDRLHLLFEAQRVADILKASEVSFKALGCSRFDCFVLGYCISHSNSSWDIQVFSNSSESYEVKELVRGALEHPVQSCGRISAFSIKRSLPMAGQGISSRDLKLLLTLPEHMLISSLKTLRIEWSFLSPEAVELTSLLQQTTALKWLTITDDGATVQKCKYLASGLRTNGTITRLALSNISPAEVEPLAGAVRENTTLQRLVIRSHLAGAGATALAEVLTANRSLQKLDILGCHIDSEAACLLADSLHLNSTLQELNMSLNHIGATGATVLAEALTVNLSLRTLHISACIDSKGVYRMAGALQMNNTLQELDMSWNPTGVTGATALAEALTVNTSLRKLDIADCNIDSEGACRLASALRTNRGNCMLQTLVMFNNPIGVTGATALAEALTVNTSLRQLHVNGCDIDSEGACQMATALHSNSTLQKLYMSWNDIGATGATALAEALAVNMSLWTLDVIDCDIDSEGACRLACALHTNSALQELNMSINPIGATGATAMAKALTVNTSLRVLHIADHSVGEQGTQTILSSLSQNTTLEELVLHRNHSQVISVSRDTIKIRWE